MKSRILDILRGGEGPHSGEDLSDRLNVSRVTIWKHIKTLQDWGYDIVSGSKGYRLAASPDIPLPWEFPDREDRIHFYEETDSTMGAARELARGGCPAFTTVFAGRQTRGRGRMSRSWRSDSGGIYLTVVLRPELAVAESPKVIFAASLALAETLRRALGVPAAVKWPNDILVEERKLAGMLAELEAEGELVSFVNVGIGINANNEPSAADPGAVSLAGLLGRPVERLPFLRAFLDRLEAATTRPALDRAVAEWKRLAVTIGREVRVETLRETVEGRAEDVDEAGALLVRTPDGDLRRIVFGDCFHRARPSP